VALLLLSAKKVDRVQNCLKEAGGAARFDRVETVDWIFSVARPSDKGVVTWRGRQRLKRVGSEFAIREDLDTPNGFWTVWVGAITAVQKNGLPVTDPAVLAALGADTRKRAFWALAPFSFLDATATGEYVGSAYFHSRLVHRVKIEIDPERGLPLSGPVMLHLDPDTALLRGVSWGGESGGECLLEDYNVRQNLLNTPALWTLYNTAGERMETLRANGYVFNSYIEDSLFSVSR
jgi:hypothetical protein